MTTAARLLCAVALLALATSARAQAAPTFVDEGSCGECHAAAQRAHAGSQHAKAMQPATAATVLGDFDGATFRKGSVTSRFFRRDGRYLVNTDGPDGKPADFEVKFTFGVEPLQQYLIELPGGRLQALSIVRRSIEAGTCRTALPCAVMPVRRQRICSPPSTARVVSRLGAPLWARHCAAAPSIVDP